VNIPWPQKHARLVAVLSTWSASESMSTCSFAKHTETQDRLQRQKVWQQTQSKRYGKFKHRNLTPLAPTVAFIGKTLFLSTEFCH